MTAQSGKSPVPLDLVQCSHGYNALLWALIVVSFFDLEVGIVLCPVDRLGRVLVSHRDGWEGEVVVRARPIACGHVGTRVAEPKKIALPPLTASGTGSLVTGNGPVVCFGDSYTRRIHAHIGISFNRDISPFETSYST